jgi:hypothetical protein
VLRSHTTVVSRWLVMPMPASALASSLALAKRPRQTSTVAHQISSASCSTQPGLGRSAAALSARWPPAGRHRRTRWRGCWWCPGRWRGCAWRPSLRS